MMIHVVLYEPEIPSNTGNIIRLCHNTGTHLHLIKPYGFDMEDKKLKRAGLDYQEWVAVTQWQCFYDCYQALSKDIPNLVWCAMTTKGNKSPFDTNLNRNVALVFGPETRGLPEDVRVNYFLPELWLRLPMQRDSRSLNLSNSVAVTIYEAWRQQGFHLKD